MLKLGFPAAITFALMCVFATNNAWSQSRGAGQVGSKPLIPIMATHTVPPYPPDAVSANAQGLSLVEVSINTSGSVDNCTIVSSAGFASLDTAACDWFSKNWRWIPATMDGKPIPVTTRVSMNWTLQEAPPPVRSGLLIPIMATHTLPPWPVDAWKEEKQGTTLMEIQVTTKGDVDNCSIVSSSGSTQLDQVACDHIRGNWRWMPPTKDGNSISVVTRVSVKWTLQDSLTDAEISYSKNVEKLHKILPRQAPELTSACYVQGITLGALPLLTESGRKNALCFFIGDQLAIYVPEFTTQKLLFGLVGGKKLEAQIITMSRENIASYSVNYTYTSMSMFENAQIQVTDPKGGNIYFWIFPGSGYNENFRINQFAMKLDSLGIKKVGGSYRDDDERLKNTSFVYIPTPIYSPPPPTHVPSVTP